MIKSEGIPVDWDSSLLSVFSGVCREKEVICSIVKRIVLARVLSSLARENAHSLALLLVDYLTSLLNTGVEQWKILHDEL